MRKKEESMEEQNRVNEKKDSNTQRQKTGIKKVANGAIRKMETSERLLSN